MSSLKTDVVVLLSTMSLMSPRVLMYIPGTGAYPPLFQRESHLDCQTQRLSLVGRHYVDGQRLRHQARPVMTNKQNSLDTKASWPEQAVPQTVHHTPSSPSRHFSF